MKVESKSGFLKEVSENEAYTINYGSLKKGSNTEVVILITGVTHVSASKSCQCTQPNIEVLSDGVKLTIKYDSNKVGTINQFVKEKVQVEGKEKVIIFNLKGQII